MDKFPSRERSAAATLELRASAIIVVAGVRATGRAPLDLCIRSALAEPWIDDVVIVDHGNAPEISSYMRALQADRRDVKLVAARRAMSAPAAMNLGAQHARGRWLLFLDPNVVLQRGAVARMAAAGGGAHGPWIVGGRLTDIEGRERGVTRAGELNAFSALAVAVNWPGPKPRKRRLRGDGGTATRVAAVSDAFMLIPRHDFQALGAFDESFATDAADLDLCRRTADAGGAILFQPAASGVQFERAQRPGRREAQGLALFAAKSAKTPFEKAFAAIARPALLVLLTLRDFVAGRPPIRR